MEIRNLPFLSLPEAARLLAVSTRRIRRLIDRGALSAVRISGMLVLPVEALPKPLQDPRGRKPLLTLHEAARQLGIAPQALRVLARDGKLVPLQIGGSLRWLPAEVMAWQNGQAPGLAA